jgi:hypothetical protein
MEMYQSRFLATIDTSRRASKGRLDALLGQSPSGMLIGVYFKA